MRAEGVAVGRGGRRLVGQTRQVVEQTVEVARVTAPVARPSRDLELGLVQSPVGEVPRQPVGHLVALGVGTRSPEYGAR